MILQKKKNYCDEAEALGVDDQPVAKFFLFCVIQITTFKLMIAKYYMLSTIMAIH